MSIGMINMEISIRTGAMGNELEQIRLPDICSKLLIHQAKQSFVNVGLTEAL